jgi:hypothetical protein
MTPTEAAARVEEKVERLQRQAERSLKKTRAGLMDARDEAVYRVKRRPLAAVAVAFGAGAVFGIVLAMLRRDRSA